MGWARFLFPGDLCVPARGGIPPCLVAGLGRGLLFELLSHRCLHHAVRGQLASGFRSVLRALPWKHVPFVSGGHISSFDSLVHLGVLPSIAI